MSVIKYERRPDSYFLLDLQRSPAEQRDYQVEQLIPSNKSEYTRFAINWITWTGRILQQVRCWNWLELFIPQFSSDLFTENIHIGHPTWVSTIQNTPDIKADKRSAIIIIRLSWNALKKKWRAYFSTNVNRNRGAKTGFESLSKSVLPQFFDSFGKSHNLGEKQITGLGPDITYKNA